jgi:ribosome-associated protein
MIDAPRATPPKPKNKPFVQIPQSELNFTYARSSGAGGQNVNKVNSKAILRWSPTTSVALPPRVRERFMAQYATRLTNDGELLVTSDRFRDQGRNAADCLDKLKDMIEAVWREPKQRRATKPTFGSKMRRLSSKTQLKEKKKSRRWKGSSEE